MARDSRHSVIYAQNFLKRSKLARQLVDTSTIGTGDLVIEIGPGKGLLTRALAERCRLVVAIEKDAELARQVSRNAHDLSNVAVYQADILQVPLPLTPYKVFANIPFNATAAIVRKLLEAPNAPEEASLLMQREAAGRFLGEPRTTLASLLIYPWFAGVIPHWFQRTDFVPPPSVDVVLLRFSKRGPPKIPDDEAQCYRDVVTYGFTAWKPTVHAAFLDVFSSGELARLSQTSGIDLDRKPSALDPEEWLALYRAISGQSRPHQRRHIAGAEQRLRAQQQRLKKQRRTRARR